MQRELEPMSIGHDLAFTIKDVTRLFAQLCRPEVATVRDEQSKMGGSGAAAVVERFGRDGTLNSIDR